MKVAFNRAVRRSPWGGGAHFATVFADYLTREGHEVVYRLKADVDVIIMLDPRQEDGGFDANEIAIHKAKHPRVKVLHRVNDTGVTRGGDQLDNLILSANQLADRTVFISNWVKGHFGPSRRMPRDTDAVITNGCDSSVFYPKPRSDVHKPLRLVTHHWSQNRAKGLDLYERIDELIDVGAPLEFTYVGRYPAGHVPKHTKVIAPLYGMALGDELRKHDVYVTAARWEACGSHHVEGAACGLPVLYHKDGGGVVEMCRRYGEGIGDVSEFKEALTKIKNHYRSYAASAESADLGAETMCAKYLDVITRMG